VAKAHITTPEGIDVKLEGTPEEIAAVLDRARANSGSGKSSTKVPRQKKGGRVTLGGLVVELKNDGFFKKPKQLGEIRKRLADLGHNYPLTTLSGSMQSQARKRNLRRFKENGKYVYAQ
jgi:hypothetical protein